MKPRKFLTQKKIDKLQALIDDNNGVIDESDLIPLLKDYKKTITQEQILCYHCKGSGKNHYSNGTLQSCYICEGSGFRNKRKLLVDFCLAMEEKALIHKYLVPNEDFIDNYLKGRL